MASVKSIIFGALAGLGFASTSNAKVINSIDYRNSVDAITYSNLGCSGGYSDVIAYDPDACTCKYSDTPKPFSGPLAPLNEGLSLHFRGPLHLKQFGVYYPKTKAKRHTHQHGRRHHAHHKRVIEDCDEDTSSPSTSSPGTPSPDIWEQSAYYNAETQSADGLIFLANYGGAGCSGTWDKCGGSSLSYMNPDVKSCSAKPQILGDLPIESNDEFSIFSDQPCTPETCGYSRPNIPAYQGFAGDKKAFVFEFKMPHDARVCSNPDMPAIWALNSKIPRAFQYGFLGGQCSCWTTGCGELDLFEVLEGDKYNLKSHYHSTQGTGNQYGGGGSQDYFPRPDNKFVKAAVIFGDSKVLIRFLPDDTEFKKEMVDGDFMDLKGCSSSVYTLST